MENPSSAKNQAMHRPPRDPERLRRLADAVATSVQASALPVLAVYVHGSWGTADQREDSDLDLGILAERPLRWDDLAGLAATIARRFEEAPEVDLADLLQTDAVFTALVVTTGDRIFARPAAADRFEIKALAEYARLNEERRDLLADILRRGTIHASAQAHR